MLLLLDFQSNNNNSTRQFWEQTQKARDEHTHQLKFDGECLLTWKFPFGFARWAKRILVPKQLFAGVRNFKHSNSPQIERAHKELCKLNHFLHPANGLLKISWVPSELNEPRGKV